MNNAKISLDGYFDRIKFQGNPDNTAETLIALHTAHTLNIPFENLDILCGREISLDIEAIYEKIVRNRRGGYCFEMNALFAQVLRQLGFEVQDLLARVFINQETVFARLHHVLLVSIDGRRYLADVGFGGNGLIAPILLEDGCISEQFADTFRLVCSDKYGYVLQFLIDGVFANSYAFTLEPQVPVVDYLAPNYFTSNFPGSLFKQKAICTRPTRQGRITLNDLELKIRSQDQTVRITAADPETFNRLISEHFGLTAEAAQFSDGYRQQFFG